MENIINYAKLSMKSPTDSDLEWSPRWDKVCSSLAWMWSKGPTKLDLTEDSHARWLSEAAAEAAVPDFH